MMEKYFVYAAAICAVLFFAIVEGQILPAANLKYAGGGALFFTFLAIAASAVQGRRH
jgi:hypothetical protein